MEITSLTRPEKSNGSPFADLGYNYLWELLNLGDFVPAFVGMDIFKDGFAKECYSGGFNGVQSRIMNTLGDMERSFSLERGVLVGRLHFRQTWYFRRDTISGAIFPFALQAIPRDWIIPRFAEQGRKTRWRFKRILQHEFQASEGAICKFMATIESRSRA